MKRWKKITSGILIAVLAIGIGAVWYFQNELQAMKYYMNYSAEEQLALEQKNEANLKAVLQQANLPTEVFDDSTLSAEEVQQKLQVTVSQRSNQQTYDAELAGMVGEIYVLRASFTGQLDGLLQQAKEEYISLPEAERDKQKGKLASKYLSMAGSLESSCDAQMEDILSRIEAHLKKTGGDTALVKEIRKAYENEKALKKSYYMSLL